MAGGPTITVRQIASYPLAGVGASDVVLIQQGGLGGPYASAVPQALLNPLEFGAYPLGVGYGPPGPAIGGQIFAGALNLPLSGLVVWNAYNNGPELYWQNGVAAYLGFSVTSGWDFALAPAGSSGQPTGPFQGLMNLSPAGSMRLERGTLSVARDPASALEVATMQWVGNQTVASFNGRKGVVTLQASDIYGALGICPPDCIATTSSVDAAICAAINDLLRTYPGVWSWMGRVGDVFLTVADMNYAAANNPAFMPPLTIPEPPLTASDGEVVTASWVLGLLSANPPGYATQAWVENYVATNAVTAFNGRVGTVNLTLADITGAGGAPIASPQFSGVPSAPTAAPGSNTGQIATTAFVQAAISGATAGVASFNGRTGTVVLTAPDVSGVGGILNPSAALTGTPTAPTAAVGNSSTQIATTAFVAAAVAAAGGVTSFNTRTGAITFVAADISGAGGALLASPAFTGTPTGPTPAAGTNNTELATTAFVNAAISSIGIGVTSFEGRTGAVTLQANDISAAGGLINPNVALSGVPTAPTAAPGNSSTQIATTAFVAAAIIAGSVTTFNGRSGAVTLAAADISAAGGALLASPSFTGVPVAPTAAPGTNTTQLATCAFVTSALTTQAANSVTSFNGRQGVVTLTLADIAGAGGAPIASPTFTGTPSVPTATAGTSTTQAASTAFVMNAIAASTAGVTSFNSRTGAVTLQANDVSAVGGALLASPQFTGSPTAPTPVAGDNSTNIATTAFVAHALSTAAVTSFNTRTGAVTLTLADVTGVGGAPLAGPNFSGVPTAPTASAGTSTTQLATTAFVQSALAGYLPLTGGTLTGALTIGTTAAPQGLTVTGGATIASPFNVGDPPVATLSASAGALTISNASGANLSSLTLQSTLVSCGGSIVATQFTLPNSSFLTTSANGGFLVATQGAGYQFGIRNTPDPVFFWQSSVALMTLASSGNLVISGTLTQGSDETTKNTIAAFAPGVSIAAQLLPKTFIYNNDPTNTQHLGFIAQDVEAILPDAVSASSFTNSEGATTTSLGLDLTAIVAVLANALKQLIGRVAALEANANITPSAAQLA